MTPFFGESLCDDLNARQRFSQGLECLLFWRDGPEDHHILEAMNKAEKKKLKTQWREQQRRTAFAALPLPVTELRALFAMLRKEVPRRGCDHSRRLTLAWLADRGHDVQRVFAWLDTQGGFCDCEVIMNVPEKVDEASKTWG